MPVTIKLPLKEIEVSKATAVVLRSKYNELAKTFLSIVNHERIYCHLCDEYYKKVEYYTQKKYKSGVFPICKMCVQNMIFGNNNRDIIENAENMDMVFFVLRMMDLPYLKDVWMTQRRNVIEDKQRTGISKNTWSQYITTIRALPIYKDLTWENSFGLENDEETMDGRMPRDEIKTLFGYGFTNEDYLFLQDQYDDWCSRTQVDSKPQEIYVMQICLQLLDIYKDRKSNKDVSTKLKALDTLMASAKLQPKQNVDNSASDSLSFGQLIEKWENEKPIPECDPEFKDANSIGKLIKVYFTEHLLKAVGLAKNPSDEYTKEIKTYTPIVNKEEENEDVDNIFGEDSNDGT